MLRTVLFLLFLIRFYFIEAQINPSAYNLSFKKIENNLPKGWKLSGDPESKVKFQRIIGDTTVLSINNNTSSNHAGGILTLELPDNFEGKRLTFLADAKADSIDETGALGLYVNVSPKVSFNNLEELAIKGTTDWNNYGVSVNLSPKETKKIEIGVYLWGKGSAKFKNLKLLIDGKDYLQSRIYAPKNLADTVYHFKSLISPFQLNDIILKRIQITGQTWGLLKYFHPEVSKGDWDMDVELFKFFPTLLKKQSQQEFEERLSLWINSFGNFSKDESIIIPSKNIKLEADYSWIDRVPYSDKLKQLLRDLSNARRTDQNAFIDYFDGPNNVEITELKYATVSKSDIGFRLLGLFRYWNIIQYYYPYRYLIKNPWDKELTRFIPEFLNADTESQLDSAFLKLFSKINDTHAFANLSNYYHKNVFGERNVAHQLKIIDNKAIITRLDSSFLSLANRVYVGDVITSINNIKIDEKIKLLRPFIAASNESVALRDLAHRLLQTDEDTVYLKILRVNEELSISIPTKKIEDIKSHSNDLRPFYLLDQEIMYLNPGQFDDSHFIEFKENLKFSKGLIFDFRNYPKTYFHSMFSEILFPEKVEFAKLTINRSLRPGEFAFAGSSFVGGNSKDNYKGKVIILINEDTQSAAEFQVMAFQKSPNVTVVGSTTSGADGNISWIPLPFGYSAAFSAIGIYYPDGRETQCVGIIPDDEVNLTIDDVKNQRDPYVLRAIELINK